MYQTGQFILYSKTGVCQVEEIVSRAVSGKAAPRLYYVLRPLYQSGCIWAPVDNVDRGVIFSRPIMNRDEAQAFIENLPSLTSDPYYNPNLSRLREHYQTQMESPTGRDLALLIFSIYQKRKNAAAEKKKLGLVDQKFMEEAEDLLYGELATALGIEKNAVKDHIEKSLRKLGSRQS